MVIYIYIYVSIYVYVVYIMIITYLDIISERGRTEKQALLHQHGTRINKRFSDEREDQKP